MPGIYATWTLTINGGAAQTLAEWLIENPRTQFRNMDDDSFSFVVNGDALDDCDFSYGDTVALFRNSVRWFTGTVTDVNVIGSPEQSQWAVVVRGPWYLFTRTMYQQPMATVIDGSCTKITHNTPKIVLFQNEHTVFPIETGIQILNAINYAILVGIGVGIGTIPAFATVAFEPAQDLTIADVIRRCLQWTPDAVAWFDYSTETPTFNCQVRAMLNAASLGVRDTPRVINSFSLQKRDDLVPSGVRFNYIGSKSCPDTDIVAGCPPPPDDGTNKIVTTLIQDEVGNPDEPSGLIGTITLSQNPDGTLETPPIGLAGLYWESLKPANWAGVVAMRRQQCTGEVRVGNVLNLTGGNAAWASMNATVQQVEEVIATGETNITVGPPSHLAPQDYVTLIQLTRRRAFFINSFVFTRAPGTDDVPNCAAGFDPNFAQIGTGLGNNVIKNANASAANANALAKKMTETTAMQTKTLAVCKEGVLSNVTVFGPP